ncbi:MAG: zinc ribbon domain-containing protein [Peptococcaceae bacterium]|nr:zinc ribbon domain-containing protein [Peptococcaceae bacterium]
MPTYDFRCQKCGHRFTVITGISERHKVTCPECGAGEVEQLITGCSVRSGPASGCGSGRDLGSAGFRGG